MPDLDIKDFIRREAKAAGLPEQFALGVAEQESSFNPNAIGPEFELRPGQKTRAIGLFQLLPETAARYKADPRDPVQNVRTGVRYLKELWDLHGGDPNKILRDYGGVKRDTTYVPAVMQRVLRYQGEQPGARTPPATPATPAATPVTTTAAAPAVHRRGDINVPAALPAERPALPTDTNIRPSTWAERHPILDKFVEGMDPNELEGRHNIAGMVGGVAGSVGGGLLGAFLGPGGAIAGRRVGAAVGSGLLGAGEQALVEETGLGQKLADWLPGETNIAVPPPAPDSTYWGRVGRAGGEQLLYDAGGQVLGKAGGMAGKRLVQSRVGRFALEHFNEAQGAATEKAQGVLDGLTAAKDVLAQRTARLGRAVNEAMGVTRQAAADRGAATINQLKTAGATRVEQAQTMADAAVLGSRQQAAQKLHGVRAGAQAAREGAQGSYELRIGQPPPEIPIGAAVREVYTGPVKSAQNAAGERLKQVAAEAGTFDLTDELAEAQRVLAEDLAPQAQRFPHVAPEAAEEAGEDLVDTGILDPTTGKSITRPAVTPPPPPPDALGALGAEVSDAERAALVHDPAMPTIRRILNTVDPTAVPGSDLHAWVSELQAANAKRGLYNVGGGRTKAEGLAVHLAQILREKLGTYQPFNEAAADYASIARLWEVLPETARTHPEQIVQLLNPNDPSTAKLLVSALTEVAEKGGGAEGQAAGAQALAGVQTAYLHRHVLQGGLKTLGARLAELRTHPEFVHAFLGDAPAQDILRGLEGQATNYARLVQDARLEIAQQLLASKQATATTLAEGKQGVRAIRKAGEADVRTARAAQLPAKRKLAEDTTRIQEEVRRLGEDKATALRTQIQQAQADLRAGKSITPQMQAFLTSTLSPRNLRTAEQSAADLLTAVMRLPNYWGGLSAMRLMKGAKDKDLLLYAAHSPFFTRNFAKHVWASAKPGWVLAQTARGAAAQGSVPAPPPPPPPPR